MNNGNVDAGHLLDRLQVPAAARPQGGYFVPAVMLADLERMTTALCVMNALQRATRFIAYPKGWTYPNAQVHANLYQFSLAV